MANGYAAGSLDTSFGGDGSVVTTLYGGSNLDLALAVAEQPDGQLVTAGYAFNGANYDLAVLRYNPDGTLDTSFDGDGIALTPVGGSNDLAFAIAIQPDGKLVVAGWSGPNAGEDMLVARYNPDGSLDATFGGDGLVTTAIGASTDAAFSLALQADGKIVAGGRTWNGTNDDFAVVRYNPDGSLDTSFDGDGRVITPIGAASEWINGIAVQPDGRIVAAGYSSNGSNLDFAVVRYNPDGSLDTSFDGDGKTTTAIGTGDDSAYSMLLQPDGKIVVGGRSINGTANDFGLVRYNSDGTLDTSFDGDGKLQTAIGAGEDRISNLALQADGKILAVGFSNNGTNLDMALARYRADGSLDSTFTGDGRLSIAIGSGDDYGYDVLVQADERIVIAGRSSDDVALVRVHGGIDQSIGGTGGNDTLAGAEGDDTIVGLGGNDSLFGAAGADLLQGGDGNDSLDGGAGNDQLSAEDGDDLLLAHPGGGADTLDGGPGSDTADLGASLSTEFAILLQADGGVRLEDMQPADGNDDTRLLLGIEYLQFADTRIPLGASTPGDDLIDLSGPGGGTVIGGPGNDEFIVDELADVPVEEPGQGIDTVRASVSWELAANFENLVLAGTADLAGTGNAANNTLTGNSGANVLDGAAGADTLLGGAGGDTYYVDDPGDQVIETANAATQRGVAAALIRAERMADGLGQWPADAAQDADTIVASLGRAVLSAYVESGVLAEGSAAREMIGNALDNSGEGNSAGNLLQGGAGNDTLAGSGGMDVAVFTGKQADYTVNVGTTAVTVTDRNAADGNDGVDALTGIEALRFADGSVALGSATMIRGSTGADALDLGGAGGQLAAGGVGNDTYTVNSIADAVIEQSGQGSDTVKSSADWTLWENVENLVLTGTAATDGAGNPGANRLTGNSGSNTLTAYAGNDTLNGGAGIDTLVGGTGNDIYVVSAGDVLIERSGEGTDTVQSSLAWTLGAEFEKLTLTGTRALNGNGNALANTLTGNGAANTLGGLDGADTLLGGGGNDVLKGGAGNDKLSGGGGADAFVFDTTLSPANNKDTLTDFTPGTDKLRLDDDVFKAFNAVTGSTLAAGAFHSGAGLSAAGDADDRIVYNTTTGTLYYDPDGTGSTAAVAFAVLSMHPTLTAGDFLIVA